MYLHEQPHEVHSQPDMHVHRDQRAAAFATYYAPRNLHVLPNISPGVPPIRLSTIIGDVVTNSRAALDYIAWELCQRHFNVPFDLSLPPHRNVSTFPIDPRWLITSALQDRLNALQHFGIPADATNEIKAVQADQAGYESVGWLHTLVNRDKHRMPLLTTGEFDNMTITFGIPAIYHDITTEPSTILVPCNREAANVTMQSDMQMKGEVAIYVTWKDVPVPAEPVERTLEQIIKTAADVIPRFDRFF